MTLNGTTEKSARLFYPLETARDNEGWKIAADYQQ